MREVSVEEAGTGAFGRLARLGFVDAAKAERLLSGPRMGLWVDGQPADPDAALVVSALGRTADPDLAVVSLSNVLDAYDPPAELLAALRESAGLRDRLLNVLGASAALGQHLARHPGDWHALAHDQVTTVRPTAFGLERAMLDAVGVPADAPSPWGSGGGRASGTGADVLDALRVAYRRSLLGLAARDLAVSVSMEEVAGELADLATATLSAALAVAAAGLPADAEPCRLAIVAMGKCGGRELNYVSDVDVVFVAEPVDGGDEVAALKTATTLASALMKVTSTPTPEGVIWPVDAALRPEGKAGPLVRTLASHEAYYKRWARTWEFQALLKARPAAGDLELGRRYVETLAPLVWTACERENFVEDVQAMRRRVESHIPAAAADRELKLGPGGLRDVEFAVQLLQLVHGRADDRVRGPGTLQALSALAGAGYVGRDDAAGLGEAYRFLRTAEHRLQLQRLQRTHLLPSTGDDAGWRWLARGMGYRAGRRGDAVTEFRDDLGRHTRVVRRLHEKLFYRPLLQAVARLPTEDARLTPEAARARLEALGFADPGGALRHLEALTSGVSRRAEIQRTLLPVMLEWFADSADPDGGLLAFRSVSDALGTTPWYLRLLRDEGAAAEHLARVLAGSRYVADLLARAPEGVAMFGRDEELVPRSREQLQSALLSVVRRRDDWEDAVGAARGVRRQELLRVATADVLGRLPADDVGRALTDVAAATMCAALETATAKVSAELRQELPMTLAVIGMGRLGGREMGYASDADVLFVHQPATGASDSDAAAAAHAVAEELRRLLALPGPDPALEVDANLRPEGRQGPLVRSLSAYRRYYAERAAVWESQALLRAAPLAGDAQLLDAFFEMADPVRYPPEGLPTAGAREVRRIKARVEAERLPRGADRTLNTKLGPGGLSDVEWTVQLLQLQHAGKVSELRTPETLAGLTAAQEAGLLDRDDAAVLAHAWRLATRARNATMLVRGRSSDALPTSGRDLTGVAMLLGYAATSAGGGAEFLDDYRRAARRSRAVVERVFFG